MANDIEIRLLGPGDDTVLANVADIFDETVQPDLVRTFLGDPRHFIAVAIDAGCVVGMATAVHYLHPDKPHEFFINEVGVDDAFRRRGLAKALMRLLFDKARALGCQTAWLGTERSNLEAMALYTSLGGIEPEPDPVYFEFDLTKES